MTLSEFFVVHRQVTMAQLAVLEIVLELGLIAERLSTIEQWLLVDPAEAGGEEWQGSVTLAGFYDRIHWLRTDPLDEVVTGLADGSTRANRDLVRDFLRVS